MGMVFDKKMSIQYNKNSNKELDNSGENKDKWGNTGFGEENIIGGG